MRQGYPHGGHAYALDAWPLSEDAARAYNAASVALYAQPKRLNPIIGLTESEGWMLRWGACRRVAPGVWEAGVLYGDCRQEAGLYNQRANAVRASDEAIRAMLTALILHTG